MRKKIFSLIILIATFVVLSACKIIEQPLISSTEVMVPTPMIGKASIKGTIISSVDGKPFNNVAVRLAQVYRQGEEGAFVLDIARSPGNFTDSNGNFIIENFDPAEYLIAVGEPSDNNYVIVSDSQGKPITYVTEAGKLVDAGILKVDYTP